MTMRNYRVLFHHSLSVAIVVMATATLAGAAEGQRLLRELRAFPAAEAHQGVAVDAAHLYAITNEAIGKYDKHTGEKVGEWTAPKDSHLRHLNGGVVVEGKLYCGHSNWPTTPYENTVEIWDAESLTHLESRPVGVADKALNWVDVHDGAWWAVYATYGEVESIRRTSLVKLDGDWQGVAQWTFPEAVIQRFLPGTNSGGGWGPNGLLYATGHDHPEVYALRVPAEGDVLELVDTLPATNHGQGIAWDRSDIGTLYGIRRKTKEMVALRLSHENEYSPLKASVKWERDSANPVLPPMKGNEFDATRCMNPWVIRVEDEYRLFYGGGDKDGKHRICWASAPVDNPRDWTRHGAIVEPGPEGSFDARWTVLPHVVRMAPDRWHLYYTGNAGRGEGLSAFPGIGLATSSDGITWEKHGASPVIAPSGQHGDPDAIGVAGGSVMEATLPDGSKEWRYYYTGCPTVGKAHALNQQKTVCLAVSQDGVAWEKKGAVMLRDPSRDYEDIAVAGPVVHQTASGSYRMWYSAIGSRWGYYSIGYAESEDGIHWRRGEKYLDNLQLTPTGDGWEKQMVEYPSVIAEDGRLRLFYCGNGYGKSGIGTAVSDAG